MKSKTQKKLFVVLALFLSRLIGFSQGFVNLDFESPNLPLVPDLAGFVPIANALPGWTGYVGGNQIGGVVYNNISIGTPIISFHGPGSLSPVLQGSYSVRMQPFSSTAAIAQMGTVPSTAQSLRFYATGSFVASFAGQSIPLSNLGSTSTYTIYGGDISGFANLFGLLQFQGGGTLDNILFSNQPIPEPSTLGLFGLGTLFLGWRLRRTGFAPLLLVPSVSQIGNNQFGIARKLTRA